MDNWPGYLIAARGGLYASLFDGIKMTKYVCHILCAIYNIPTTQEKSIFFGAYMVFLWFHNHCKLALLGSEAQWSICEFCPTSLAGFLGFHRNLLVQDSIWIYLFGTVSHYGYTVEPSPHAQRARPVQSAGWGCSLVEVATTSNYSNIRWRSPFIYGSLGFILLLCFCSTTTYYFGICCQFSLILTVTFGWWDFCPVDTIYPLCLSQFYTFGPGYLSFWPCSWGWALGFHWPSSLASLWAQIWPWNAI